MPTPKRVLHVFSSFEVGGSQRRFATYMAHTKANCVHSVYAMDGCYDAMSLIDGMEAPEGNLHIIKKGNTYSAIKQIRALLKHTPPDLVVTYNWGATEWVLANYFTPICPVIHIQDGFAEDEQNKEKISRKLIRMLAYNSCKAVVVPSLTLEKIAKKSWRIPPNKLHYIPNGIEIDRFICPPDTHFARSLGIDTDSPTIGIVAALRPEKNVGKLIEAFSHVEDEFEEIQLVIVGDGVGMSALKMLAERVCRPNSVIFTGSLTNPEKILPSFDIFALSSDTEQMPLSVIEAMSAALPIISTDVGDITNMVSGQNLPYISGNSAQSLAENLISLLKKKDVAQKIGATNQAKAKELYSLNKMIKAYDDLFTHHTHQG